MFVMVVLDTQLNSVHNIVYKINSSKHAFKLHDVLFEQM